MTSVTRLCSSKSVVTVNGQYPGPTLFAREGDHVEVNVVNHSPYNMSIHWHGVRQLFNDTEAVIAEAVRTGGGPNISDAYTINGLPGPLYNCSAKG
jgi:laccase